MSAPENCSSTYRSPKRKREVKSSHSLTESQPLQDNPDFDSPGRQQQINLLSEEGSPRATVENQLKNLKLKGEGIRRICFGNDGATDGPEKRLRRDPGNTNDFVDIKYNSAAEKHYHSNQLKISETPAELEAIDVHHIKSDITQSQLTFHLSKTHDPKTGETCKLKGRSKSPTPPITQDTSPEPQSMTWREDEITGHNPDDPDDDGEGLNCIGFKPTPAVAYAQTQHRKQQLLEWKSREAREARQKRSERRRGVIDGNTAGVDEKSEQGRRKVRFQERQS